MMQASAVKVRDRDGITRKEREERLKPCTETTNRLQFVINLGASLQACNHVPNGRKKIAGGNIACFIMASHKPIRIYGCFNTRCYTSVLIQF